MTLVGFVRKNTFRNKRRSLLTTMSIAFSLLLLSFLMSVWRAFYANEGSAEAAQRLIVRHKISLANLLPSFYAQKVRAIPGVAHVVPITWFQGIYKDQTSENLFARFGTDPDEFFDTYKELSIPQVQIEAWKRDRAGAVVDVELAKKYGWKIGDRIVIQGDIFPVKLELTLRGVFTSSVPNNSLYFNWKYVEEGFSAVQGQVGWDAVLVDSPQNMNRVASAVDQMFANAPEPTKTETEKAFQLSYISTLGNVKAFILIISLASVFTILLTSGNTIAMSIRERTREVAVLKTLGFRQHMILGLFVGEAVTLAVLGGVMGTTVVFAMLVALAHSGQLGSVFQVALHEWRFAAPAAFGLAIVAALLSAAIPSYAACRTHIVEGLRHID